MNPRYSLLLLVQNAELYLDRALESVFTNSSPDFEVIAIEMGSRDDSALVLEEWAATERRLRVLSFHCSEAEAFNAALVTVKGDWVGFLHARQTVRSGAWAALNDVSPQADIVFTGTPAASGAAARIALLGKLPPSAWMAWFSRRLLRRSGASFHSQTVARDLTFTLRCITAADGIVCQPAEWASPPVAETTVAELLACADDLGALLEEAMTWQLSTSDRARIVELAAAESSRILDLAPAASVFERFELYKRLTRSLRRGVAREDTSRMRRAALQLATHRASRWGSALYESLRTRG